MPLLKKENIVAVQGTYQDQQGAEKKEYRTIGEVLTISGQDGSSFQKIKLYHMPGADISLFEQKPKEQATQQNQPQQETINPVIPF